MERRNFLKLLGLGAVGSLLATVAIPGQVQAATLADQALDTIAERSKGEGDFAQMRRRRRMRRRMMRHHRRMMRRRMM